MKPSSNLFVLCLASLLLVSSALSPSESSATPRARPTKQPGEPFLARFCDPGQNARPVVSLRWCHQQLQYFRRRGGGGGGQRRRYQPMPPPSRDGEEVDVRYGVSKRLVPTGPNPLHN